MLKAVEFSDKAYIDGRWQEVSGPSVPVVDPETEAVTGHIRLGGRAEVDSAVAAARRAFETYSRTTPEERRALLERIVALLEDRAEEFADAIVTEMGAAIGFVRASQIPFGIEHFRVQAEVLKTYPFLRTEGHVAVAKEPIGVCALITPWNWPLYQITAKVAPALAAGCTVILKPSELSPYSALLFAKVIDDAGVPPGVFNMINGSGEVVGAALSSHPGIDMISITGSTRAGVLVAQAAAPTVKRVVQELGGKSPNIFLDDADFASAIGRGVLTGMRNVGQSCSAPTRMLVPASRLEEAERLAVAAAAEIKVGDPRDEATAMGPIANAAQYARVQEMIQAGIDDGARLLIGGLGRPEGLEHGYYVRPTIFSGVTPDMRIAQEEIFGPVLAIMPYADEADAVRIANDTVYGLGAHVQSADLVRARAFARQVRAGQVHINYPAWSGFAPFGGYKQSGNGREYADWGIHDFLEVKGIVGYGG